jgi:hypothetical protein
MELEIEQTTGGLRVSGEMTVYSASALKPVLLQGLQIEREALELDLQRQPSKPLRPARSRSSRSPAPASNSFFPKRRTN